MAHSEKAKSYLANIADISLISVNNQFNFYRVKRTHSYFLEGTGIINTRSTNQLMLRNLEGDVIILKYHYIPGMRSDPPTEIDGIKILDDPQPFIRITQPPQSLRLFLP